VRQSYSKPKVGRFLRHGVVVDVSALAHILVFIIIMISLEHFKRVIAGCSSSSSTTLCTSIFRAMSVCHTINIQGNISYADGNNLTSNVNGS